MTEENRIFMEMGECWNNANSKNMMKHMTKFLYLSSGILGQEWTNEEYINGIYFSFSIILNELYLRDYPVLEDRLEAIKEVLFDVISRLDVCRSGTKRFDEK